MNATLKQTHRRFLVVGRNALRLCVPALIAISIITVAASEPAGASAPRIKKPGAPTAVTAIALGGGAAVSWTAPGFDGGTPITGFTVIASRGGATCTTTGATACTLTGLANGHLYRIKVRASNAKGEGRASTRVQVTPSLPTVSFGQTSQFPYSGGSLGVGLSQPSTSTVQAGFTTSDGPEAILYLREWIGDAADFSPNSGTVTFAPGQTVATISFTVIQPNVNGCSLVIPPGACWPSLTVTLASPTNALLDPTPYINLFYQS